MMPSSPPETSSTPAQTSDPSRDKPDRLILVYDADSGFGALLLDVVKKVVGKEDCALCEITYSPIGKRGAWRRCEARLGLIVDELHRDQLPPDWGISRAELPCILARRRTERPFVLVTREQIAGCHGVVEALEQQLHRALSSHGGEP